MIFSTLRRAVPLGGAVGVIALALLALPVLGHQGEAGEASIAVEPGTVTAGATIVVAGSGLEPDTDRVLVLAGADLTVDFGTVHTDAEGMFQKELEIPAHLPGGIYELRCIGDETITAELSVTAAAGAPVTPAPEEEPAATGPRSRPPVELAVLVGLALVSAALGVVLVLGAERFRGVAPD